jgi:hypothetical protein
MKRDFYEDLISRRGKVAILLCRPARPADAEALRHQTINAWHIFVALTTSAAELGRPLKVQSTGRPVSSPAPRRPSPSAALAARRLAPNPSLRQRRADRHVWPLFHVACGDGHLGVTTPGMVGDCSAKRSRAHETGPGPDRDSPALARGNNGSIHASSSTTGCRRVHLRGEHESRRRRVARPMGG